MVMCYSLIFVATVAQRKCGNLITEKVCEEHSK